jgi:hypothetical protein
LEAVLTQTSPNNFADNYTSSFAHAEKSSFGSPSAEELKFELGLWLSGLESFLKTRNHSFTDENRDKTAARDWTKEFRLTHSTLLLCSKLNFQLGRILCVKDSFEKTPFGAGQIEITAEDVHELSVALKDSILLNESLLRAAPTRFGEWTSWCAFLSRRLNSTDSFEKLIAAAENDGEQFLPEILQKLFSRESFAGQPDLRLIVPRFARILKWLSVVGRMLRDDEPLKPTLLIFARIYEQTQELIAYINNRLLRFPNEESEFFNSLDGASYTASIEIKKVYNQELNGLVNIRSSPSVYARIETAYALLNDSFQQTLVSFARLIDPQLDARVVFPDFQTKFEQSIVLRRDLWRILQIVKIAEQQTNANSLLELRRQLGSFLETSLRFLFYKDQETVERFVEEILITTDKKDLVPILHRFGAYLETLFGQVNMRTMLANHPFDYGK